jgi:hypothetical protein
MTEIEKRIECYKVSIQMYSLRIHYWMAYALYQKSGEAGLEEEAIEIAKRFIILADEATEELKTLIHSL